MENGDWQHAITNSSTFKNPCVSLTKLKQTMKGSLCYSESNYVHFRLNKSILQELWIFFVCVYTKKTCLQLQRLEKYVCHWLLAPPMQLYGWIDVYYKHICGNILTLWNHLFLVSTRNTKYM